MAIGLRIKLFAYFALHGLSSPLQLRDSIRRLSRDHPRPSLALLRLFFPYPTWRFALPDPLMPHEILGEPALMLERRHEEDLPAALSIPVWRARDTPLRCLYRMYESVMAGDTGPAKTELEFFFYQAHWAVDRVPDPQDPDSIRYAVLACLVDELSRAFNWWLSRGLRRDHQHLIREKGSKAYPAYERVKGPKWTSGVPPVGMEYVALMPLEFAREMHMLVLDGEGGSEVFARRNIAAGVGWMYQVPGMEAPLNSNSDEGWTCC